MKIRLKLFATLKRFLPGQPAGTPVEVELPTEATLAALVEQLHLPPDEVKICFVNGRICELDTPLHENDEIGIFPPIGGG